VGFTSHIETYSFKNFPAFKEVSDEKRRQNSKQKTCSKAKCNKMFERELEFEKMFMLVESKPTGLILCLSKSWNTFLEPFLLIVAFILAWSYEGIERDEISFQSSLDHR